jgi:hypothetical protein
VRAGLADGSIARGGWRLQRGIAGGERVVVRVVANVGLREALVSGRRGPWHFEYFIISGFDVCDDGCRSSLRKVGMVMPWMVDGSKRGQQGHQLLTQG